MASRRGLSGVVSPDRVLDPETRRCLIALMQRIQWIIDNWPKTTGTAATVAAGGGSGGGVSYVFEKSILDTSGVVALVNDSSTPGASKVYGTNAVGNKGWFDLPTGGSDHPFKFTQTSDTGGTITAGLCFIGGVSKTITSLPTTLSSVTTSIKYWLAIEIASATVSWVSGTSYPDSDDDTEIWPILEITCSGSVISSFIQKQSSDVHITKFS